MEEKHSEIVILEGILNAEWYRALFELAVALYGKNIYAYYFDIPLRGDREAPQNKSRTAMISSAEDNAEMVERKRLYIRSV